jgi:hypothetical protein
MQFKYFDVVLLDYFSRLPDRFQVSRSPLDVEVASRSSSDYWRIRFDLRLSKERTDILVPFAPDFAKLPSLEQQRWKEFELADPPLLPLEEDARFLAAYRQDYEGEFVDWPPEGEN